MTVIAPREAPSLQEIDARRQRLGVQQKEMCKVAEVAESTLTRNRNAGKEPSPRIRRRLVRALDQIATRRGIALLEVRS